jgi:hypothetical protein
MVDGGGSHRRPVVEEALEVQCLGLVEPVAALGVAFHGRPESHCQQVKAEADF